jgi:hypothetical protein
VRVPFATAALALVLVLVLAGCRPDTVRIAYHPDAGSRAVYDVRVRTDTVLSLAGRDPVRRSSTARVRATQTVLGTDTSGATRVQVRVERAGSSPRTFVALLDGAAHVRAIESVEGLPASVLGDVGLPELVPSAASVVPDASLRPGQGWAIDVLLTLPGTAPSRLRGSGRLVSLGVVDGHDVGVVRATTRTDVDRTTSVAEGRIRVDGTQSTTSTTRHALSDGSVVEASSVTSASFAVTLSPPAGTPGQPVDGTLRVVVRSTVSRSS